jgi:glutaredoxin
MIPKIEIYFKVPCPYCVHAKEFFNSRNLKFEAIDLTGKPDEYVQLKDRTGHMTVPQIFINDKFIGGYSDLKEAYDRGDFKGIIS